MHGERLFLSSLFLTAALTAPMAIRANAVLQKVLVRVYDPDWFQVKATSGVFG
jgi:hypothetical protein